MGISIESIWSKAQRLSASDRLALSRRLRDSVNETDSARQARVASEIDRFFGGWSDDPRSTDEIMQQIREGFTSNRHILASWFSFYLRICLLNIRSSFTLPILLDAVCVSLGAEWHLEGVYLNSFKVDQQSPIFTSTPSKWISEINILAELHLIPNHNVIMESSLNHSEYRTLAAQSF